MTFVLGLVRCVCFHLHQLTSLRWSYLQLLRPKHVVHTETSKHFCACLFTCAFPSACSDGICLEACPHGGATHTASKTLMLPP